MSAQMKRRDCTPLYGVSISFSCKVIDFATVVYLPSPALQGFTHPCDSKVSRSVGVRDCRPASADVIAYGLYA